MIGLSHITRAALPTIKMSPSSQVVFTDADEPERAGRFAMQTSQANAQARISFMGSPVQVLRLTPGLLELLGVSTKAEFALYGDQGRHTEAGHPGDYEPAWLNLRSSVLTHVGARRVRPGMRTARTLVMRGP